MDLSLTTDTLLVRLSHLERLAAFRPSATFEVPLSKITRVSTERPAFELMLRAPGTSLPGVIKAGTYYGKHGKEFWYAVRGRPVLTLDLDRHPYRRLVLAHEDAAIWAQRVSEATG